jgi:hypothetical protein
VTSLKLDHENWLKDMFAAMGEVIGLACDILVHASKSLIYLDCDKLRLVDTRVTKIPRKKFSAPKSFNGK